MDKPIPTLEWIGKDKVINHKQQVLYHVLEKKYTYNIDKSNSIIIFGDNADNLEEFKELLLRY